MESELPAVQSQSLHRRIYRGIRWRARDALYAAETRFISAVRPLLKPAAPPELILHIGAHKTGSTSIQLSTLRHRKNFLRHGVYPLRSGQGIDGAHHALLYSLDDRPVRRLSGKLIRAEITRAGSRRILISSEVAWEIITSGGGDRLIDLLRGLGVAQVHLVIYIRCPYAFANSMYSQKTSSLLLNGRSFDEYVSEFNEDDYTIYRSLLDLIKRPDVALTMRPYRGDVVDDFAQLCGVSLPPNPAHENKRLGPIALEALRLISKELEFRSTAHRERVRNHLRLIARTIDEKPFWAVGPEQEAQLSTAEERTEEFCQAIWGKSWREALRQERRPRNIYDESDPAQRSRMLKLLEHMRLAAPTIT
jgi:hypothetical protein